MATIDKITYGAGGYDPDATDGNIVSSESIEISDLGPSEVDRIAAIEDALVKSGNSKIIAALKADPRSPVQG